MKLIEKTIWSDTAFEQQAFLQKNQPKIYKKLKERIKFIKRNPQQALEEAENLKGNLSGFYSFRLSKKDRLVFDIVNNTLEIIECRLHYNI